MTLDVSQRYERGDATHSMSYIKQKNSYFWTKLYFTSGTSVPGVTTTTSDFTVVSVFPDAVVRNGNVHYETINVYSSAQNCGAYNVPTTTTQFPYFVAGTWDPNPFNFSATREPCNAEGSQIYAQLGPGLNPPPGAGKQNAVPLLVHNVSTPVHHHGEQRSFTGPCKESDFTKYFTTFAVSHYSFTDGPKAKSANFADYGAALSNYFNYHPNQATALADANPPVKLPGGSLRSEALAEVQATSMFSSYWASRILNSTDLARIFIGTVNGVVRMSPGAPLAL
jgi:hypothetical protein